ncbi:uncharacterized protein [Salmo salar]|uniref:Reverse transcriptase domain-containing protein n=1 Tax=Salmo salar TaxID=8030 RepID=A0A1S3SNK3_SALSA|nr:uncharacterized protein LOC106610822 [Salmo salar]|eukprot:XP_014065910.1 PREDICTED: uncharacterized protein LOC106610822 [Salmo salar]
MSTLRPINSTSPPTEMPSVLQGPPTSPTSSTAPIRTPRLLQPCDNSFSTTSKITKINSSLIIISLSCPTPSASQSSHLKPGCPNLLPLTLPKSQNSSCHPRVQLASWTFSPLFSSKPALCLYITHIVNLSLTHVTVPSNYKTAAVTSILKKPGLDTTILNNFRPISNLPFLAKTLEHTVASQLQTHLLINNLFEPLQSGLSPLHITEPALLKVVNELLTSADAGALNILILLDLSAAFDAVRHQILLIRLEGQGVEGFALSWRQSYLTNQTTTSPSMATPQTQLTLRCGQ